jgi:hypothetical protein
MIYALFLCTHLTIGSSCTPVDMLDPLVYNNLAACDHMRDHIQRPELNHGTVRYVCMGKPSWTPMD